MSVIKRGLELPADSDGKVQIPNCSRRDLPGFLKEMGCKVGVEVGVQRGYFTRRLCKAGLKVYGVDPWISYPDYYVNEDFKNRQDAIYVNAIENTREFGDNAVLIKKMSMDALADFEEESLDFVYVDGHHGFKYVAEDIFEWSKKVKRGGIISGHDYAYSHKPKHYRRPYILQVRYVIDAYVKALNIPRFYVIGAEERMFWGESRDTFRSWFWIKDWDEKHEE